MLVHRSWLGLAGVGAVLWCAGSACAGEALTLNTGLTMAGVHDDPPGGGAAGGARPTTEGERDEVNAAVGSGRPDPWTFRAQLRAWWVAPGGDVHIPGSAGSMDLKDVGADRPEISPSGQIDFQADEWMFTLRGTHVSAENTNLADRAFTVGTLTVAAGDNVRTEMDWTMLELSVGYLVWSYDFEQNGRPNPDNLVNIWVLGGGRIYDYTFEITQLTGGPNVTRKSSTFGEAFLGVRAELQVARDFSFEVELSHGRWFGSRESISNDILASFNYRPCHNFGVQVGYRLLTTKTSSGEGVNLSEYNGDFAGVFFGGTLRF